MKRNLLHLLRLMLVLGAPALLPAQTVEPETYHTASFGALNPNTESGGRYSGLTGYAAPDGREYAILGGYDGTYVIDVTEKPIKLISKIEGPRSGWREIKTAGQYAYVVNETGRGLQIIDLSKLPLEATHVLYDTSIFRTGHTISYEGKYLYVHGSNVEAGANSGTLIFDISKDPLKPELTGTFAGHYVHDATIRNDTLYAAAIMDNGLSIVYLGADRKHPQVVAEIHYPGAGTHNSDLTTDGSYVMTTDEVNGSRTLKVWDVRDRENIQRVADYTPQTGSIVHNVHTVGKLAYVSWYSGGTRILDMTDPSQPAQVGYFDAFPGTRFDFVGNWEVYPYLPSGKILASYMETGLQVFTFDGAERGSVRAVVRNATTKQALSSVVIDIPELGGRVMTDASGRFSYVAAADDAEFTAYLLNFKVQSGTLSLKPGAGNEQEILLEPLSMAIHKVRVVDDATGEPVPTYGYHIINREKGGGKKTQNPSSFSLPLDSSYTMHVGAWGYIPTIITIGPKEDEQEIRLQKGYADNAEVDQGWAFGDKDDWTFGGFWSRLIPVEVLIENDGMEYMLAPSEDNTPNPGQRAFFAGLGAEGAIGFSPVYGITTITSPLMNLSGYSDPYLNCALWYSNNTTGVPDDFLVLKVSDDNGKTWQVLDMMAEATSNWREQHLRLRDVITPGEQVRFRIVAYDTAEYSIVTAGMDDFSITEGDPSSVQEHAVAAAHAEIAPNPASGAARLLVSLPAPQRNARMELFDLLGRRVALLHDGALEQGTHGIPVDLSGLAPGRYTWRMRLDDGAALCGAVVVMR